VKYFIPKSFRASNFRILHGKKNGIDVRFVHPSAASFRALWIRFVPQTLIFERKLINAEYLPRKSQP
jgi:hypothetical protein